MRLFILTSLLLFSFSSHAIIIGKDDRVEVTSQPRLERLASSTATMVAPEYFALKAMGLLDLNFEGFGNTYNLCKDERFFNQSTTMISCSGFLVGPDLLVTAGHCMLNVGEAKNEVTPHCEAFSWLFGHKVQPNGKEQLKDVNFSQLYSCKKVVYAIHNPDFVPQTGQHIFNQDFALIQLDRPVVNFLPATISKEEPKDGDAVEMIGYPNGLPAKASLNGKILELVNTNYFRTDLDVLGGNSGSPVFNQKGEVVGIAVRSFPDEDYLNDKTLSCQRPNTCTQDRKSCAQTDNSYPVGSEIQKIQTLLPHLKDQLNVE